MIRSDDIHDWKRIISRTRESYDFKKNDMWWRDDRKCDEKTCKHFKSFQFYLVGSVDYCRNGRGASDTNLFIVTSKEKINTEKC